ncbi:MAG: NAD-dependent epimerase/dehydratase family protein [Defluviitaleaceae bacterium]|nr:NAD-dependent epimerase/dehydratase family protein [Defluviitaleaceae bacterium]
MSIHGKKRVLVVGANSYIGDKFGAYANNRLHVDIVDSYNQWKSTSFEGYDCILMVAGIAHQRKARNDLHFAINRDLAIEVGKKSRASGVRQFIYMSSMAVYGIGEGVITKDTMPFPNRNDYYGLSKFEAEKGLDVFFGKGLCIVRPPIVYGPGCPGNFGRLIRLAKRLPVFPDINNQRSMIFIDNLCEFLVFAIENVLEGIYLPQNKEYVCTSRLVRFIGESLDRKIATTGVFNPVLGLLKRVSSTFSKLFGDLIYEMDELTNVYSLITFEDSVKASIDLFRNHVL